MMGRLLCLLGLHDVWRWTDERGDVPGLLWVYCKRRGCDW